jgi:predicted nucleic acid-binding protein
VRRDYDESSDRGLPGRKPKTIGVNGPLLRVPRRPAVQIRITHQQAVRLIESFRRFPVQDITSGILMAALDTRQRFQLSYWDSAIIEASRVMGCAEVLSEDLGDGQDYAGVRVVNPFR